MARCSRCSPHRGTAARAGHPARRAGAACEHRADRRPRRRPGGLADRGDGLLLRHTALRRHHRRAGPVLRPSPVRHRSVRTALYTTTVPALAGFAFCATAPPGCRPGRNSSKPWSYSTPPPVGGRREPRRHVPPGHVPDRRGPADPGLPAPPFSLHLSTAWAVPERTRLITTAESVRRLPPRRCPETPMGRRFAVRSWPPSRPAACRFVRSSPGSGFVR